MEGSRAGAAGPGRIVLLCSDLEVGGIQRVVVNLANGLAERGMDVVCAVLRRGGAFRPLLSPGVRVEELGCTSQPLALLSPGSKLAACLGTERPGTCLLYTSTLPTYSRV